MATDGGGAAGADKAADLVLEGGGVKGIAHLGALSALEADGYTFHRVAGTSAGAVVGALVAACLQSGKRVSDIVPLLRSGAGKDSIDYAKIPDGRIPVPVVNQIDEGIAILQHYGANPGQYLRDWVHRVLKDLTGVETFADLELPDASRQDLSDDQRYRLVVLAADVSRGSLVRLPWDYRALYGLNPDEQYVADAVRASASIPFFFRPSALHWGDGSGNVSYVVDGGACSDFPIEIFDRTDGGRRRWPTFGVKLAARQGPDALVNTVSNVLNFATSILETAVNGNDQIHLADPCVVDRTIFIDTSAVGAEDFDLTPAQQQQLFGNGEEAARAFLTQWDWDAYQHRCPPDVERVAAARGESLEETLRLRIN
jgi:NTE family protein